MILTIGRIICAFLFCFLSIQSWAADYYVSTTGTSPYSGSKAEPYRIADIPWADLEAGSTNHTIYLFGGTYTDTINIRHNSATNTLFIKPCSASPSPSGCDTQVILSRTEGGNIGFGGGGSLAKNVTIDGETTSGSGTRNIKVIPGHGTGIEATYGNTNIVLKYLEITGLDDTDTEKVWGNNPHSIYAVNFNNVPSGTEIAYCYFHDNWGHTDIVIQTDATGYGRAKIHHNTFEKITMNAVSCGSGGVDIYNNTFDLHDTIFPYDVIHAYATDGIKYIRFFNNFVDNNDQSIFLENASTNQCSSAPCATEHIRIHNNVFTCTDPASHDPGAVFFGGRPIIIENADAAGGTVDDVFIVHNDFVNTQYSVNMAGPSSGVVTYTNFKVVNNIISETSSVTGYNNSAITGYQGNVTWANAADAIFDGNLVYDNDALHVWWLNAGGGSMTDYTSIATFNTAHSTTNVNDDPHFTSSTDFTLTSASHARGAGLDASAYTNMDSLSLWPRDKNGTLRSAWDIGAYEYDPGKKITIGAGGTITFGAGGTITLGN